MRFLADESMPGAAVQALRQAGLDVAFVREGHAGLADHAVLAWAAREDRVLLTFDTDFGELALQAGLPQRCGIILFRRPMPSPGKAASWIGLTIGSRRDWAGMSPSSNPVASACGRFTHPVSRPATRASARDPLS